MQPRRDVAVYLYVGSRDNKTCRAGGQGFNDFHHQGVTRPLCIELDAQEPLSRRDFAGTPNVRQASPLRRAGTEGRTTSDELPLGKSSKMGFSRDVGKPDAMLSRAWRTPFRAPLGKRRQETALENAGECHRHRRGRSVSRHHWKRSNIRRSLAAPPTPRRRSLRCPAFPPGPLLLRRIENSCYLLTGRPSFAANLPALQSRGRTCSMQHGTAQDQ